MSTMRNGAYGQSVLPTRVVLPFPGREVRTLHFDETWRPIESQGGARTTATKLMRTYVWNRETLAGKEPPMSTKAARLELAKKARVEDAMVLVFAACLKHLNANERVALRGVDPEGIHEMRVALRRMRAALSDFRKNIPAPQVAWLKRESKWLITSLSTARDWDVFLHELLAPVKAARLGDLGLAELRAAAEAEREKGYSRARSAILSRRYSSLLARMRRWLSAKRWRQGGDGGRKSLEEPARELATRLLAKRHKAVLKLGRNFEKLSPEERHQLRIALKKLRYTADFFRSLYRKKREKRYIHSLAQLQNSLGNMNDIVMANHLFERLSAAREDQRASNRLSTAIGIVAGWHTHNASSSEHEAEANWREFSSCNPFWV
jgi:triphosphatase